MEFISITPENNNASKFNEVIKEKPAFVKLYSPKCSHCTEMQKAWDDLKDNPELKNYNMAIIEVHEDELPKIKSSAMAVNGGFPTIRKVLINGTLGKDFDGKRTTEGMVKFIKENFAETLNKSGGGKKKHYKKSSRKSKKKSNKKSKKHKSKRKHKKNNKSRRK